MQYDFFPPRISEDTKGFWEGCKEHKLRIQKCSKCGKLRWPAAYLCPDCLSEEFRYVELSGKGVVYSSISFKRAFHPQIADQIPYTVATIDLDEGVRFLSNITNTDGKMVACGTRVKIDWVDCETYSKPVFLVED